MIHILSHQNSVFQQFLAELRHEVLQKDRARFVRNLKRIGQIFAFEISKTLEYQQIEVPSPLGIANMKLCEQEIAICTVLRAGLPLYDGLIDYFDEADSCFIAAFRQHHPGKDSFDIEVNYVAAPDLEGKVVIIADTMLATGASMVKVVQSLRYYGKPKAIHLVSVIASTEGVEYVKNAVSPQVHLWLGAIDEELTAQGYIVPGLGDAGDLAFGKKV